jgi:hypothetical protein
VLDSLEESLEAETRGEWERAAFIGWQFAMVMGAKVRDFRSYLRAVGLSKAPEVLAETRTDEQLMADAEALLRHWREHPDRWQQMRVS